VESARCRPIYAFSRQMSDRAVEAGDGLPCNFPSTTAPDCSLIIWLLLLQDAMKRQSRVDWMGRAVGRAVARAVFQ